MTTHAAPPSDAELIGLVRAAIETAGAPLSASAIGKKLPRHLKRDAKTLAVLLDEHAAHGRLHRFAKGRATSYGLDAPHEFARKAVLDAVSEGPRTWAELKKTPALKAAAKLMAARPLDAARDELVREGRFYQWPKAGGKGGRSPRFCTRPADPRPYLNKALDAFRKELAKVAGSLSGAGVTREAVERAAVAMLGEALGAGAPAAGPVLEVIEEVAPQSIAGPPVASDLAALVLDRMNLEDPGAATGAPVSIRALRRALAFQLPEWAGFEETLVGLAEAGLVALHRHDHPAGITGAERAELVPDGRGGYYVAVSRRA
jgi:hypothetical protein